jgi:hypothetical protein
LNLKFSLIVDIIEFVEKSAEKNLQEIKYNIVKSGRFVYAPPRRTKKNTSQLGFYSTYKQPTPITG